MSTDITEALKTAAPEPHEVVFGGDTTQDFDFTRSTRSPMDGRHLRAPDPGYRETVVSAVITGPSEARVSGGVWLSEDHERDDILGAIPAFADWAQFVYDHADDCEWECDEGCDDDDRPSLWVGAKPRYTVEVTDCDGDQVYWEIAVAYPVGLETN